MNSNKDPLAAFVMNDPRFRFVTNQGSWSHCGLDIYVRNDLANQEYYGVVVFTQNPDENPCIAESIEILAARVMDNYFLRQGMDGIEARKILWLESYQPTRENRYGRMERIRWGHHALSQDKLSSFFCDPFWYITRPGVVEKLMARTWEKMYLTEIKRFGSGAQ